MTKCPPGNKLSELDPDQVYIYWANEYEDESDVLDWIVHRDSEWYMYNPTLEPDDMWFNLKDWNDTYNSGTHITYNYSELEYRSHPCAECDAPVIAYDYLCDACRNRL